MLYKRPTTAYNKLKNGAAAAIFQGDCNDLLPHIPDTSVALTITSPPYCMGKEYESGNRISNFIDGHEKILPEIARITRPGGSICWQVGYWVKDNEIVPLDYLVYEIMKRLPGIKLRNRAIWTFGSGLHCSKRFSGRHEVILWFTKGDGYWFDLDAIRVAQKYPGKKASKGPKRGQFSGNPLGKNPSDVWDIPNVKACHVEKTDHPCQFPVALASRCIRALSRPGDIVFDPFGGVLSAGVAALMEGRRFLGAEQNSTYAELGCERLRLLGRGELSVRPIDKQIHIPSTSDAVAIRPKHFAKHGTDAHVELLFGSRMKPGISRERI